MVVFSYVSRCWFQRYFPTSSSPFIIFLPHILNHIVQVFLSYFLSHPKICRPKHLNLPGQCHHLCSGFGCDDLRELGGSRFFRQNKSQQNRSKKFQFNFQHSNLNSSFFHSIRWIRWCAAVFFWISQTIFFQEKHQGKSIQKKTWRTIILENLIPSPCVFNNQHLDKRFHNQTGSWPKSCLAGLPWSPDCKGCATLSSRVTS